MRRAACCPNGPRPRDALVLGVVTAVLCAITCLLIYWNGDSSTGVIKNSTTDHLHHSRAAVAFLKYGFDMYRKPFGVTGSHVPFRHGGVPWPEMPFVYPPGVFLLFLPTGLLGEQAGIPTSEYAKIVVIYVVVLSFLALFAIAWCARHAPGGNVVFTLFVAFVFVFRCSAEGFYDAIWVGVAALAILAWHRRDFAQSILFVCAACLLNYRAVVLAPIGLDASIGLLRDDTSVKTKVATFAIAALVEGLVLWTFFVMLHHAPGPNTAAYKGSDIPLAPGSWPERWALATGVALTAATALRVNWVVAAEVAVTTWATIKHGTHSWHSSVLFVPLLTAAASKRAPAFWRDVLAAWVLFLQQIAYWGAPIEALEWLGTVNAVEPR